MRWWQAAATKASAVAAAPWQGSQVPWRRPPGGGMRGPQCGRAAMLSLRGHLRRRPVPLWGFPSAHPGGRPCPVSRDCPVWPPAWALGVSSWPEGRALDSWVLVQASKVSTRLSASGMGQAELGSSGLGVRQPSLRPRCPWQGAQLLRCLSLCPRHLSCLFFVCF